MKRTAVGKFVPKCFNRLHSEVTGNAVPNVNIGAGVLISELSDSVRSEWAKENKERARKLPTQKQKQTSILCDPCFHFFENRACAGVASASTSSSSTATSSTASRVNAVIEQLQTFNTTELAQVARFLAESQVSSIREDIKQLHDLSDVETLIGLDVKKWTSLRNPVVCAFVKGIITPSRSKNIVDESKDLDIAKTVEQMYYLQNKNSILPLSLSENLVVHAATRSQIACDVISSSSPSGSHSYILEWLKGQAVSPLPPPAGDVLVAFDNDQVIGKTYHVRVGSKLKASVITSTCIAEVEPNGTLQCRQDLKPGSWMTEGNISEQVGKVLDAQSDFNKAVDSTHYKEIYRTLQEAIDTVASQQISKEGKLQDHVDDEVDTKAKENEWKVCWACGTSNMKTKRVCVSCAANLKAQAQARAQALEEHEAASKTDKQPKVRPECHTKVSFSYMDIDPEKQDTQVESQRVKVNAGEPIFVNPNSHASVLKVLQEIGRQVQIAKYVDGGPRQWVAITCDGLPFTIAQRVLKETYTCAECKQAIFTWKAYVTHCEQHDSYKDVEESDLPRELEFDWVILRIGHGHFEMNMVRSFFALNWDVFLKDLARCMGFCSENAQKYAKSGSDHHKAWEMLQILYYGTIQELVVPYVRESLEKNTPPTPDGFLRWSRSVRSPQFQYMQEQMLTYASSIIHLRKGIRHNDMALVLAGRVKYAPIFHSRNHPKYQLIEMTELANFLAAPPDVQEFLRRFQAISASGDGERCEDMDFVLETINKKSKAWAPRGVPTQQDWQRIFRNLGKFDELRKSVFKRTRKGSADVKHYSSAHAVHDEEITAWRTHLRSSHFLQDPGTEADSFTSVSLEKLDHQLVHLTDHAVKRRRKFACRMFGIPHEGEADSELDPVFVTEAERAWHTDVRNQRKDTIASRVLDAVESLDDEGIKTMLLNEWESVKQKRKEEYILFFHRVEEEVANQQQVADNGDDSDRE